MTIVTHSYLDLLSPQIYIEANGSLAQDIARAITKFEYSDDVKKFDTLKLTIENRDLRFIDDPRFRTGAQFRVRWGYPLDLSMSKLVIISKAKPTFPADGMPTIEMVAFDLRQEMNKTSNAKNWGKISSSAVAAAIGDRWGLNLDIEDSKDARKQHRIQPGNVTDVQYLITLAEKLNFDFYIDGTTLHFHSTRVNAPAALSFTYFTDKTGTLRSFTPEVNMNRTTKVGVSHADPRTGDHGSAVGTDTSPRMGRDYVQDGTTYRRGRASVVTKDPSAIHSASPETDKKVAKVHADAAVGRIDLAAVKASISVVGTPRLRARTTINLSGVGKVYAGKWRVVSTKHVITGSGGSVTYSVDAQLTRNALNGGGKKDAAHDPAKPSGNGAAPGGPQRVYLNTDGAWAAAAWLRLDR